MYNQKAAQLCGWQKQRIIGKPLEEVYRVVRDGRRGFPDGWMAGAGSSGAKARREDLVRIAPFDGPQRRGKPDRDAHPFHRRGDFRRSDSFSPIGRARIVTKPFPQGCTQPSRGRSTWKDPGYRGTGTEGSFPDHLFPESTPVSSGQGPALRGGRHLRKRAQGAQPQRPATELGLDPPDGGLSRGAAHGSDRPNRLVPGRGVRPALRSFFSVHVPGAGEKPGEGDGRRAVRGRPQRGKRPDIQF